MKSVLIYSLLLVSSLSYGMEKKENGSPNKPPMLKKAILSPEHTPEKPKNKNKNRSTLLTNKVRQNLFQRHFETQDEKVERLHEKKDAEKEDMLKIIKKIKKQKKIKDPEIQQAVDQLKQRDISKAYKKKRDELKRFEAN